MRWLEFLGLVPRGDHAALRFSDAEHWEVTATKDGAGFFRGLARIAPPGSVLYLEGSTEAHVPKYLAPLQLAHPKQVAIGTILPASDRHHLLASVEHLVGLANVIEEHGVRMPCIHLVLHDDDRVLVSWYDAFTDDPMLVSSSFTESQIEDFATTLGVDYRWRSNTA